MVLRVAWRRAIALRATSTSLQSYAPRSLTRSASAMAVPTSFQPDVTKEDIAVRLDLL